MSMIEIRIPDIGDFKDVPIIEVHVKPGDKVAVEDPLLTLESDKATLEVPCPQAGTIGEVKVKSGDKVSEGDLIVLLEAEGGAAIPPKERLREDAAPSAGDGQAGYGSPAGAYESIEVKVPDIIINPPGGKGAYWINESGKPVASAEEWRENAAAHQGSWWTDWFAWLAKRSGKKVKQHSLGSAQYPVLQDAPGSYVLEK